MGIATLYRRIFVLNWDLDRALNEKLDLSKRNRVKYAALTGMEDENNVDK